MLTSSSKPIRRLSQTLLRHGILSIHGSQSPNLRFTLNCASDTQQISPNNRRGRGSRLWKRTFHPATRRCRRWNHKKDQTGAGPIRRARARAGRDVLTRSVRWPTVNIPDTEAEHPRNFYSIEQTCNEPFTNGFQPSSLEVTVFAEMTCRHRHDDFAHRLV